MWHPSPVVVCRYLDIKKNIFPRFFFVANTALLHILSNGNDPPAIMPHLGSCFDAMCDLRLVASQPAPPPKPPQGDSDDEAPPVVEPLKDTATAMVAKDGEMVELFAKYTITGAVETWLNQLVAVMQDTLKQELDNSMDAAAAWESDMPRETWLYSYPAQIVLLASQVHWTEESESALEECVLAACVAAPLRAGCSPTPRHVTVPGLKRVRRTRSASTWTCACLAWRRSFARC